MSSSGSGRYVPPHLRGKKASSNNSSSAPTSASTTRTNNNNNSSSRFSQSMSSSSTSSPTRRSNNNNRWNNLGDSGGNDDHRSSERHGHNNNGYNNSGRSAPPTTTGSSRWANVDRSAIGKQQSHQHQRGNSKPSYNNNNHYNNNNPEHDVKAIFFGDSFIKLFGLLNDYSDSILKTPRKIEVQKYKAASAKGLTREHNENRTKILDTMRTICIRGQYKYKNLERLVFCFGSVDVHMSFYYKKYVVKNKDGSGGVGEAALTNEDLQAIATDYVDFVATLSTSSSTPSSSPLTKLIVGIYPSPLCDKHVGSSLLAYGSLETQEQVQDVNASEDCKMTVRQDRVHCFNTALKDRCEYHNNNNNNNDNDNDNDNGILEYYDVEDELLTTTTTALLEDENNGEQEEVVVKVKDAYKDVSDLNIHLIHETTLQLWVQKWPWYKALTLTGDSDKNGKGDGNADKIKTTKIGFVDYLQETFDEYRKTKPWAERTHVAETMGVQLSL